MNKSENSVLISDAIKKTSEKKYKCPYCDLRIRRSRLHIHIQNKHAELIPEGYTALRIAFNTINHKTEGYCIMCRNVTEWDESKGRYNRLCNSIQCKENYKKMCASRNKKIYGTERLQTDPRYADSVQRKALAGRRISGKYTFSDGIEHSYVGSYEKKFLEFMDKVMMCKSEDLVSPGPTIAYTFNGEQHNYLPDFYYTPYNLLIEIKDGGDNPNNHPHRTGIDKKKIEAKENAIKKDGIYNYVRVVNNDFGQLMEIMAAIKYNSTQLNNDDQIIRIHENFNNISNNVLTLLDEASFSEDNIERDDGKLYPVYVILIHSGTWIANTIKSVTHAEFSHSSISFDSSLHNMHSFGAKKITKNLRIGGFKKEDISNDFFTSRTIPYAVYVVPSTLPEINRMKMRLDYFEKNESKFKYDTFGLLLNYFKIPNNPKFKYFCSRFVADILNSGRIYSKEPSLVRPNDFKDYKFCKYVTSGILSNYDSYKVDIITKKIIRQVEIEKRTIRYVSEDMSGTLNSALAPNPLPYESNKDNYYIIQYPNNNSFDYAITKDPMQSSMYSVTDIENGKMIIKKKKSDIDKNYITFKIKDSETAKELYNEFYIMEKNEYIFHSNIKSNNYIYNALTESNIINHDQLLFDNRFKLVKNFDEEINYICDEIYNYLNSDQNKYINKIKHDIDYLEENTFHEIKNKIRLNIVELNNCKDADKKNEIINEIISLGWNPELPYSEESLNKLWIKNEAFSTNDILLENLNAEINYPEDISKILKMANLLKKYI